MSIEKDYTEFVSKQAQNLCIDASVEQRLTKSKFVENYLNPLNPLKSLQIP